MEQLESTASWEVVTAHARHLGLRVQEICGGYAIAGVRYLLTERPLAIDRVNVVSQKHGEDDDLLSVGAMVEVVPDRASVAAQMRQLFKQ